MKIEIEADDLVYLKGRVEWLEQQEKELKDKLHKFEPDEVNWKCQQLAEYYTKNYFQIVFETFGFKRATIEFGGFKNHDFFADDQLNKIKEMVNLEMRLDLNDDFKSAYIDFIGKRLK
jgi:hypothetical protein